MENNEVHLHMTMQESAVSAFFQLLACGFHIDVFSGQTIQNLLCGQIGLDKDYVDTRIQTVFLNGRAVDNIETAIVPYGATLALSAAMPGLVGATFRRGGHYSIMRSQISHSENRSSAKIKDKKFILKLFNIIGKELGPDFLSKGIWVDGNIFQQKILQQTKKNFEAISEIRIDGKEINKEKFLKTEWGDKKVFLKLDIIDKS